MSPNRCHHPRQQAGFLLPTALFIIIILGGFSLLVAKQLSQTSMSYLWEGLSTQAFYAAESGTQAGLHQLFASDTIRQLVDGRCAAMSLSQSLSGPGLNNCSVSISCVCRYEDNSLCDATDNSHYSGALATRHSFYTIESQSQCGASPSLSMHSIEVGASL